MLVVCKCHHQTALHLLGFLTHKLWKCFKIKLLHWQTNLMELLIQSKFLAANLNKFKRVALQIILKSNSLNRLTRSRKKSIIYQHSDLKFKIRMRKKLQRVQALPQKNPTSNHSLWQMELVAREASNNLKMEAKDT